MITALGAVYFLENPVEGSNRFSFGLAFRFDINHIVFYGNGVSWNSDKPFYVVITSVRKFSRLVNNAFRVEDNNITSFKAHEMMRKSVYEKVIALGKPSVAEDLPFPEASFIQSGIFFNIINGAREFVSDAGDIE